MTRGSARRAEATLRRQVLRALRGLREDLSVWDAQQGIRVRAALDRRLAQAKGTVRKAFSDGYATGWRQAWR